MISRASSILVTLMSDKMMESNSICLLFRATKTLLIQIK